MLPFRSIRIELLRVREPRRVAVGGGEGHQDSVSGRQPLAGEFSLDGDGAAKEMKRRPQPQRLLESGDCTLSSGFGPSDQTWIVDQPPFENLVLADAVKQSRLRCPGGVWPAIRNPLK